MGGSYPLVIVLVNVFTGNQHIGKMAAVSPKKKNLLKSKRQKCSAFKNQSAVERRSRKEKEVA